MSTPKPESKPISTEGKTELSNENESEKQFATFYLADRLYGIDVMQVQEVTSTLSSTVIRKAPKYIKGLINLRGQIATSIGLRELFGLEPLETESEAMAIVCKMDTNLISLQVDRIGDVIQVSEKQFEPPPDTLGERVIRFLNGVYKLDGEILSSVNIDSISVELNI